MIYYLGLISIIVVLRVITQRFNTTRSKKYFFWGSAGCVIVFQGLRSFSVGIDLSAYIPAYLNIGQNLSLTKGNISYQNFEIGYILLNKVIFAFGANERVFLIVIAACVQIPIFYTLYKYSESPLLSILVYFAFGNFLMTFSGLRQSISMSLCFFAYTFIKDKKLVRFIITIIVASLFHKSALFCLLMYPCYYLNIKKAYFPLIITGILIIFLFRQPLLMIVEKLYYGEVGTVEKTGAYTMFLMYVLLYVISFFAKKRDYDYIGLSNILLLLACVNALSSVHSYIARIGYPLSLYLTILVPKMINCFGLEKKSLGIIKFCSGILCILCFYSFCGTLNTLPFSFMRTIL